MNHYFSEEQDSILKLKKITVSIRGIYLPLFTGSGTFSIKKVDKGSRILIEHMIIKPQDLVLDLGCGYGPIGLFAAHLTKNKVVLTDINKRAVKIAKMNAKMNNIKNIRVVQGDIYEKVKDKKFDVILTNPPQTAGKYICFKFIEGSKLHLKKSGTLQLVARHNKGGKTLESKMEKVFGNVETIAKNSGYRVYLSKNIIN